MLTDRQQAPLFEALVAHAKSGSTAFHVPGHKQRAEQDHAYGNHSFTTHPAFYYRSLLPLDVTELPDTDDLHHPEGAIAESHALAATCFGAEETRFLVGGSTAGNLAMIIGVCQPGDLVIVQRNVHKSIIHGLMMAGARAVMLQPVIDSLSGLALMPDEQLLEKALERYGNEAKAVILSTPNYYGMAAKLDPLVKIAHCYNVPVLVDEAHGAHFGFHPDLPEAALRSGADLVVQSTHKMLSAMTMGAMLHMQGDRLPRQAVRQALAMVQSSSPSYPIMASLDLARREVHAGGPQIFAEPLAAASLVVEGLERTSFRALGYGAYKSEGIAYDPLKLILFDVTDRMNGFRLRDELAENGCAAEMADDRYVVLAFGTGSIQADGRRLLDALKRISEVLFSESASSGDITSQIKETLVSKGPLVLDVSDPIRFGRETYPIESVELEECEGRTAAEWVIPYPPGIPVLYPGERITADAMKVLLKWRQAGSRIQGAADTRLRTIQVRLEAPTEI
ncbi:aminotransferase class I/II-fold pyridoxal phosphate-dependent enzyme [Cohnella suwonensis]|uniref:Aminotransferase class I/II-fold pyridoxal phosphate-dependent enzyme n=1 Tax=Cohnella suwonensis TaxID=696072 RepID=A0ABW0LYL0_9BACL